MKGMWRFLRWGIPVVLMAAGLVTGLFWDSLALYLAPKTVLRSAVVQTCDALQTRFRDNPMLKLLETIGPGRSFRLQMESGEVLWDLSGDIGSGCLMAEGTANVAGKEAELSFYLDEEALAVMSEQMTMGNWYGITMETFSEDIRKIPLLSWIIPDGRIAQWERSLTDLSRCMANFPPSCPMLSEIRALDIRQMTLGLLALPAEADSAVITLNGEAQPCRRITCRAEGDYVGQFLSRFASLGENVRCTVSFYLLDRSLALTDVKLEEENARAVIRLTTGTDPLTDPLSLSWKMDTGDGEVSEGCVCVRSREQGSLLSETWTYSGMNPDSFSYAYDRVTGAFSLTAGDKGPIRGVYKQLEDGFRAETADFGSLWEYLSGKERPTNADGRISVTVKNQGKEIKKPRFKNPDAWTMEDFLNLMEGIGGLIGLDFI